MALKSMAIMADLETTVDPDDVRAWAVCAVDIETLKIVHIGTSLDGFMEFLSKGKNTKCYFHNLKFDGEFILYWLLTNGYTYKSAMEEGKRQTLNDKEFTALITDDGLFYSIEVMFHRRETGKLEKVTFYDSLKKLPFKVSVIAKAFELEMAKGEIDYKAPRPRGWELTEEEKEYIIKDCKIVAEALKIQFSQGLKKMTAASDALNGYKEIIGRSKFEKRFPVLPKYIDDEIRRSYRGGFVYLKPEHKNKRGLTGLVYDKNSMHPAQMYYKLLPYGYPIFFEGKPEPDPDYPLFIVHFKCCFELKPGHIPTIQVKGGRFTETEYLTTSSIKLRKNKKGRRETYEDNEPVELVLTSVDYFLMLEHYDIENETYINGYKFKGITGLFKEYIDYWMHIKETTTGALKQLAKLMLNSLYGKFASATSGRVKIPYLDPDSGCVEYTYSEPEIREPVYTAMSCFITAYSRKDIIESAQKVYDRFIYADTDSLHLIGDNEPEGLDIHPTRLGAWKNEGSFVDSKYIRAKTYMETIVNNKKGTLKNYAKALNTADSIETVRKEGDEVIWHQTKVTCAGMPDSVKEKVTYDNFCPGSTFTGKLVPRRYPGGIILVDSTFTIK